MCVNFLGDWTRSLLIPRGGVKLPTPRIILGVRDKGRIIRGVRDKGRILRSVKWTNFYVEKFLWFLRIRHLKKLNLQKSAKLHKGAQNWVQYAKKRTKNAQTENKSP